MEIETGDLFRSAYLLCAGGRLMETRMLGDGEVVFLIGGESLGDDDLLYRTGRASVNPLQLRESLNLLRDLIFERKRAGFGEHERRDGRGHHGQAFRRGR